MPVDPNEPTYCLCHQVSYGEMIGCDNPDVSIKAELVSILKIKISHGPEKVQILSQHETIDKNSLK